jgi:hypothetical protein
MITLPINDKRFGRAILNLATSCVKQYGPSRGTPEEASERLAEFINEQGYEVILTVVRPGENSSRYIHCITISEEDLVAMILKWGLNDS